MITTEDKILITGATGSLGKYVCEYFKEKNYQIIATGRSPKYTEHFKNLGITFIQGDLTDRYFVDQIMSSVQYVIHCAALTGPYGAWEKFKTANVDVTKNIKQACEKHRIKRILYLSTPSIYYSGKAGRQIKEDQVHRPALTNYAKSKLMAEEVIDGLKESNVELITLRPRAIISDNDAVILPRLLKILNKGIFPLMNQGSALVDLTYVDNVIHAIELALTTENKEALYRKYNITNGEPRPIKDVVNLICQELGMKIKFISTPYQLVFTTAKIIETSFSLLRIEKEPPITSYGISLIGLDCSLSIDLAKKYLNYSPIVSLDQGLANVLNNRKQ